MSALTLATISHRFNGQQVLDTVSLVIRPGETVALVGPSGSGKSTLAAIAAGILSPDEGRVMRHYKRHGMVFQQARLLPWCDARENIAFPLTLGGGVTAQIEARVEAAAEAVALLAADLTKRPAELSGGMQARVAIARALVVDPDFLIFDEPFAALDPALRHRMQNLVLSLAEQRKFGALFITHDLAEAARLSHRIAVLDKRGKGVSGALDVPGVPGQRADADMQAFLRETRADRLLHDLVHVDERAMAPEQVCDVTAVRRCC